MLKLREEEYCKEIECNTRAALWRPNHHFFNVKVTRAQYKGLLFKILSLYD